MKFNFKISGVARRVEYYNQVVNVIVGWLSNDVDKL